MAWEWSKTQEAYENARGNIGNLGSDDLEVIYAEIMAHIPEDGFDNERYEYYLSEARGIPDDLLSEKIWDFASEQRTCDNGGFQAWVCPYGCHTVSFDREEFDA